MSRIPLATAGRPAAKTTQLLEAIKQKVGAIPNVYAVIGHSPASLSNLLAWSEALATGGLSKREVELLSLHVAELNGCGYCVSAHTMVGRGAGLQPDEIMGAREGRGANSRENAILALARRVVRTGGARAGSELDALRREGVSDAEVIDILAVVALNQFRTAANIVAQTENDFPPAPRLPRD